MKSTVTTTAQTVTLKKANIFSCGDLFFKTVDGYLQIIIFKEDADEEEALLRDVLQLWGNYIISKITKQYFPINGNHEVDIVTTLPYDEVFDSMVCWDMFCEIGNLKRMVFGVINQGNDNDTQTEFMDYYKILNDAEDELLKYKAYGDEAVDMQKLCKAMHHRTGLFFKKSMCVSIFE